jgi:hypothetical protein
MEIGTNSSEILTPTSKKVNNRLIIYDNYGFDQKIATQFDVDHWKDKDQKNPWGDLFSMADETEISSIKVGDIIKDKNREATWKRVGNVLNAAASKTKLNNGPTLARLIEAWVAKPAGTSEKETVEIIQNLGNLADSSPEYKSALLEILKEKYPSGYLKIYRSNGEINNDHFKRTYTNVTGDRGVAQYFERGDRPYIDAMLKIDGVIISINDITAIGDIVDTEFVISTKILRERTKHPLKIKA